MSRIHSFENYIALDGANAKQNFTVTSAASAALTIPSSPKVNAQSAPVNAAIVRIIGNSSSTLSQPIAWFNRNGQAAVVGEGLPVMHGDIIELFMSEVTGFRIIGADANAQSVNVEYGALGSTYGRP